MVIQYNMSAANANRQYGIIDKNKAKSTERLSSGYRINRAADDAAGLAISEKMRRQIRGLTQGVNNTQDGVSLCQVADGALNELQDMMHRISELSVQAANGTHTTSDREMIQEEINQIIDEVDRISEITTFNEQKIFDGNSEAGSASSDSGQTAVQSGTKAVKARMTVSALRSSSASTVCGDFTVTGGTLNTDYTFSNGKLTILTDTAITIQNTNPSAATSNQIYVNSGVNANITLAGVNIVETARSTTAFEIAANSTGNVTITLVGDNTLQSGPFCAALQKNGKETSGTLTITGNGTLTAIGGYGGAGIGGGNYANGKNSTNGNGSNIIINGGTITATGGTYGAGIGGGDNGDGSNITINGGTVTAKAGSFAEAIGSGSSGTSTNVQRLGGIITENGVTTDYSTYSSDGSGNTGSFKQWWIQSGTESGDGMYVKIDNVNSTLLGIKGLDVTTEEGAGEAITAAGTALKYISKVRSDIGAQQNRLEHTIANENNIVENTTAAESRIRDTDMAEEMVVYSTASIIAQVGEAMIAQANVSNQGVLALLQ